MPLLGALRVSDVMTRPRVIFDARNEAGDAADKLRRDGLPGAPVVDQAGAYIGTARLSRLEAADPTTELGRLADPAAPAAMVDQGLDSALEALLNSRNNWVPVLGAGRRVVGVLPTSAVVRSYRDGLANALRQLSSVSKDTSVVDAKVGSGSPLAGVSLADAGLPEGTIVMTLQRGSQLVLPRGGTVLEVGDQVGALTRIGDGETVRQLVTGGPDQGPDTPPAPAPPDQGPDTPPAPALPGQARDAPSDGRPASQDSSPSSTTPSAP
ncbi:MAG: TrkA C-terminal domain-containing protein [Acidimicrobiales bacterium]